MIRTWILLLSISLLLAPMSQAAPAAEKPAVSKEQAINLTQQRYPGKIMKVKSEKRYYRVRVLQENGRVITVLVDNSSGQVQKDGN